MIIREPADNRPRPNIKWSDLIPLLHKWGLDPNDVFSVTWDPSMVEVEVHMRNADGHKYALPNGNVASSTYRAPRPPMRWTRGKR